MEAEYKGPDLGELVEKWLDIVVDRLHQALDKYDIGKLDGELWKSIMGHVVGSGQDVEAVVVKFLQHGRFADMNVGRGRRGKSKPWYSKTKTREVARLREVLAENLSSMAIGEVENAIRRGIDANFQA